MYSHSQTSMPHHPSKSDEVGSRASVEVKECKSPINEQIDMEFCESSVFHALYAYLDRDNVALKGLAKFFKEASEVEKEYAEKLMEYPNKGGGRVKLLSLHMPPTEFDHVEKGDALHAAELALSLEKLTNEKLLKLLSVRLLRHAHAAIFVADSSNNPQLADFVEWVLAGAGIEGK